MRPSLFQLSHPRIGNLEAMNLRRTPVAAASLLTAPARALAWFNTRHPYSHNDYFHDWILSNLPKRRTRALDVGCGEGLLAERLASRFGHVTAADPDPLMRAAASARRSVAPITVVEGFDSATGGYDLITMVASLHHLPLRATLERCRDLLLPGGKLLVVGLAKQTLRPADLAWEAGSAAANPLLGLLAHPRPYRGARPDPPFPVAEPRETVAEIAAVATQVLGDARVERRIPFRYTLSWQQS